LTFDRSEAQTALVESLGKEAGLAQSNTDVLQGTLDMLILKSLSPGPMHGWGVSQRIQQISKDALRVNQGSLYPALYRLEQQDWIRAEWGISENNRRAKFYRLTAAGRRQLESEEQAWRRFSRGVELILASS
jgi:transcriptional regulator